MVRIDAALVLGSFELRSLHSALNDESYGRWIERVETIVRDGQERGAFGGAMRTSSCCGFLTMGGGLVNQLTVDSSEVDTDDRSRSHSPIDIVRFGEDGLAREHWGVRLRWSLAVRGLALFRAAERQQQ